MNKARYVAALIAGVSVAITVAGASAALWFFRQQPPAVRPPSLSTTRSLAGGPPLPLRGKGKTG